MVSVKGQTTSGLTAAAIAILALAIIVSIGAQILGEVETALTDTSSETEQVNCTTTNASRSLGHRIIVSGSESAIREQGYLTLTSGTHPSGNYTITDYIAGTLVCHEVSLENQTINVTYSYELLGTSRNTTIEGISAVGEFGDWFTIIVIVLIAVFVIALILRGFGGVTRGV